MDATMRIAEVADRSGCSAATLRYYEEVDLLPPPQRTPAGYRVYDRSVLERRCRVGFATSQSPSSSTPRPGSPSWWPSPPN